MTHDTCTIEGEVYQDALGRSFPVVLWAPEKPVVLLEFDAHGVIEHYSQYDRRTDCGTPLSFFGPSRRPMQDYAARPDPRAYEGVPYLDASALDYPPKLPQLDLELPADVSWRCGHYCGVGLPLYIAAWHAAGAEIGYIRDGRFVPSAGGIAPAHVVENRPVIITRRLTARVVATTTVFDGDPIVTHPPTRTAVWRADAPMAGHARAANALFDLLQLYPQLPRQLEIGDPDLTHSPVIVLWPLSG